MLAYRRAPAALARVTAADVSRVVPAGPRSEARDRRRRSPAQRRARARTHGGQRRGCVEATLMASCGAVQPRSRSRTPSAALRRPVIDPFIGTVVGERYRIVSRIGVGGMGACTAPSTR
jgi:hypothetical protein